MMNVRGQAIFLSFMLAITFFFIGLIIAPAITKSTNSSRDIMDCGNTSIDTSQKINCTLMDLGSPYTVAIIFGLAGGLIGAKVTS